MLQLQITSKCQCHFFFFNILFYFLSLRELWLSQQPRLTNTLPYEISSITLWENIDNQITALKCSYKETMHVTFFHILLSRARYAGDRVLQSSHVFRIEATEYWWTIVIVYYSNKSDVAYEENNFDAFTEKFDRGTCFI